MYTNVKEKNHCVQNNCPHPSIALIQLLWKTISWNHPNIMNVGKWFCIRPIYQNEAALTRCDVMSKLHGITYEYSFLLPQHRWIFHYSLLVWLQ